MDNEIIGYAASILIIVSLLMSNANWFRWINLSGCILFVIYGLWVTAYPVALMNGVACVINIYYLVKIKIQKKKRV